MTTTIWWPNTQSNAQTITLTVTAVATSGTLTGTINGKTVVYTCTASDTTSTAAAAWQAILANTQTAPPEFSEITWTVAAAVITGVAVTPGTPFTLTSAGAGGATVSQATVVGNSSPSDVNSNTNWLRGGSPGIPQTGDDVIISDSNIPLLWNLHGLAAVQFASFTRRQSFTAQIGLPNQNANGYLEYRPTHFQFSTNASPINVLLGQGAGNGPSLERYDVQAHQVALVILAGGQIDFLGTSTSNTVDALGCTLNLAASAGEAGAAASVSADGGCTLNLGSGFNLTGALSMSGCTASVSCAPGSIVATNGSQVTVNSTGLTYASIIASGGSTLTWLSNSTITALTLTTASRLDKSGDYRPMTITNATQDGDTTQIVDTLGVITYSNPVTINNAVTSGPFTFPGGATVLIVP